MKKILLVEDDTEIAEACAEALRENDYEVEVVRNGAHALSLIETLLFDAAILDVRVPGATGLEIAEQLRTQNPRIPIIIMTGFSAVDPAVARKVGAVAFLQKPFSIEKLLRTLAACLR